jgi:hypothetical protein
LRKTFFAEMVFEWKATPSRLVLTTSSTKKEIIQADLTIIITNVVGMGFCARPFLTAEVETERFSASMAEFKEVRVQDSATNLTVTDLHAFFVRGLR